MTEPQTEFRAKTWILRVFVGVGIYMSLIGLTFGPLCLTGVWKRRTAGRPGMRGPR